MRIYVSSPPLASDTAYGYEMRYLDFARMLMAEGITPHDLKEHYHDFEWIQGLLHKEYQKIIERSINGNN